MLNVGDRVRFSTAAMLNVRDRARFSTALGQIFEGVVADHRNTSSLDPEPAISITSWETSGDMEIILVDEGHSPGFSRSKYLFYPYYVVAALVCEVIATSARTVPASSLKEANTQSGATVCAGCGGLLKDPMPWLPYMKHCPKCEP